MAVNSDSSDSSHGRCLLGTRHHSPAFLPWTRSSPLEPSSSIPDSQSRKLNTDKLCRPKGAQLASGTDWVQPHMAGSRVRALNHVLCASEDRVLARRELALPVGEAVKQINVI